MAEGPKPKKKEREGAKEFKAEPQVPPRLRERFRQQIAPALMKQFRYGNI